MAYLLFKGRAYYRNDLPGLAVLLEMLKEKHGSIISKLTRAFVQRTRMNKLTLLTQVAATDEQRFLLALLLFLPTRQHILEMLTLECPDQNAAEKFVEIVKSLDDGRDNVWGFALKPLTLAVLRCVLDGLNAGQIVARFGKTADRERYSPDSVESEYRQLRAQLAFEALFTDQQSSLTSGLPHP